MRVKVVIKYHCP